VSISYSCSISRHLQFVTYTEETSKKCCICRTIHLSMQKKGKRFTEYDMFEPKCSYPARKPCLQMKQSSSSACLLFVWQPWSCCRVFQVEEGAWLPGHLVSRYPPQICGHRLLSQSGLEVHMCQTESHTNNCGDTHKLRSPSVPCLR